MSEHNAESDGIDWMAEAALYCQPHGEKHDDLACLRLLAEASLAGGRWSASTDSCDCGDGYGCSHGSWVHAVHMERTHNNGKPCDPENSLDSYRHERSELSEFTWDEAHYIVAAQPSVVLGLLDRLAAAEALADRWEDSTGVARGRCVQSNELRAALSTSPARRCGACVADAFAITSARDSHTCSSGNSSPPAVQTPERPGEATD